MAEKRKVTVGCSHTNGLVIFLFQHDIDDGTGAKINWHKGPGVRLNGPSGRLDGTNGMSGPQPGFTEIDGEWWDAWVAQNKGKNALFDSGLIFEHTANPTS